MSESMTSQNYIDLLTTNEAPSTDLPDTPDLPYNSIQSGELIQKIQPELEIVAGYYQIGDYSIDAVALDSYILAMGITAEDFMKRLESSPCDKPMGSEKTYYEIYEDLGGESFMLHEECYN